MTIMTYEEMLKDMLLTQHAYDAEVFKAHGLSGYLDVSDGQITAALLDECGELNHELKSRWCWWKKTQAAEDREKVLEELADVMHFVFFYYWWSREDYLNLYHYPTCNLLTDQSIMNAVDGMLDDFINGFVEKEKFKGYESLSPAWAMASLVRSPIAMAGSYLRVLIERCGFTVVEAYDAYLAKNKINRQRIVEGY